MRRPPNVRAPAVLDYAALLRASIDRSGLSRRAYAETVLVRDERSLRRWVAGDPMPRSVRTFLERELRALASVPDLDLAKPGVYVCPSCEHIEAKPGVCPACRRRAEEASDD